MGLSQGIPRTSSRLDRYGGPSRAGGPVALSGFRGAFRYELQLIGPVVPYALDQERHILFPHELNVGIDDWFEAQARNYLQAGAEGRYGRLLTAAGAAPHTTDVREELLADFTGDALADNDPTKFQAFVQTVVEWL